LIHTYEQEIQKCGWKGGIPYWDWTLDSADDEAFFSSPIFDNKTGFGGNGKYIGGNFSNPAEGLKVNTPWDVPGRSGGGCLDSGPFAGLKANLGPEASVEPTSYCVRRDFSAQSLRDMSGPAMVKEGNAQKDYGFFDQVTELSTHSGGHWGIGGLYGTMTDKWASPADPLFYLHHANVDRSWWSWQSKDLRSRVYDISGPIVPFDYGNQAAGNVTMDTPISIFETERTQVKGKVWDVMHIQKGPLCYVYDSLY
jgi:tyrosinase